MRQPVVPSPMRSESDRRRCRWRRGRRVGTRRFALTESPLTSPGRCTVSGTNEVPPAALPGPGWCSWSVRRYCRWCFDHVTRWVSVPVWRSDQGYDCVLDCCRRQPAVAVPVTACRGGAQLRAAGGRDRSGVLVRGYGEDRSGRSASVPFARDGIIRGGRQGVGAPRCRTPVRSVFLPTSGVRCRMAARPFCTWGRRTRRPLSRCRGPPRLRGQGSDDGEASRHQDRRP